MIDVSAIPEIGINCPVVLFSSSEEFVCTSVEDRGSYWRSEFDRLLPLGGLQNAVVVRPPSNSADMFPAVNERVIEEALLACRSDPWSANLPGSVGRYTMRPSQAGDGHPISNRSSHDLK